MAARSAFAFRFEPATQRQETLYAREKMAYYDNNNAQTPRAEILHARTGQKALYKAQKRGI